jgi:hypothetical protein
VLRRDDSNVTFRLELAILSARNVVRSFDDRQIRKKNRF